MAVGAEGRELINEVGGGTELNDPKPIDGGGGTESHAPKPLGVGRSSVVTD